MITVLLGPLLPTLASRWSLNDTQSGYLFVAQFLGSLVGTVTSGIILTHLSFRRTMVLGVALMALGAATLLSGSYLVAAAAAFCYGSGTGVTSPAANLLVARSSGPQRSSSLNLLNFFWSAGAVSCPFLLAPFVTAERTTLFLTLLTGFLGLLILVLLTMSLGAPDVPVRPPSAVPIQSALPALTVLLIFGSLFFLYVGTESALGAWLASYAKRSTNASQAGWITVPAYFYGAVLVGRLAGAVSLREVSDVSQARFGALLATLGVLVLLASQTLSSIALAATIAGLGMSTLYPIAIGLASSGLGSSARRVMGSFFALSTLGGASMPWLVGYTSTEVGSLRVALVVPLAGCAVMAALYFTRTIREAHARH